MSLEIKLKIKVDETELELSLEEARELMDSLQGLLNREIHPFPYLPISPPTIPSEPYSPWNPNIIGPGTTWRTDGTGNDCKGTKKKSIYEEPYGLDTRR